MEAAGEGEQAALRVAAVADFALAETDIARLDRIAQAAGDEPGGVHRVIGLLVAPGRLHPVLAFTAVLCIAVAAGACGAINMWYDRDIDAVMHRTAQPADPGGAHRARCRARLSA